MRVTYEKPNRFVLHCSYKDRETARRYKFIWDADSKYWYTTNFEHATRLREYFDEPLRVKLERVSLESKPWPGGEPPLKPGYKLLPHQLRGFKFAMSRNHSYLSFDMGLGKTLTSIAVLSQLYLQASGAKRGDFKALIIAPPFLLSNWFNEIKRFLPFNLYVNFFRKKDDRPPLEDIILVADSILLEPKVKQYLTSKSYNLVIVDEAHRYLIDETKRTKALYGEGVGNGIVHSGEKVVLLSGTPMRKGHIELYPCLKALAWNEINYKSKHSYALDFCGARQVEVYSSKYVWDYSDSTNADTLKILIEGSFFLTEKLEDNVKELKGLLLERVVILDHKLSKKVLELDETLRVSPPPLSELVDSQELGQIAEYRRLMSLEKVKPATEYVKAILEDTASSVLVFFHHTEAIEKFSEAMAKYNPYVINGKTAMKTRDKISSDFQAGKSRILIANIGTMVGLNLTKATRVVFAESSWNSTDNDQARSRAYRIGQDSLVTVDHLTIAETLDEYVLDKVIRKRSLIKKLF